MIISFTRGQNFSLVQTDSVIWRQHFQNGSIMVQFFLDISDESVENIVRKGENAGFQAFSPLPRMLSKGPFPQKGGGASKAVIVG